MTKSDLELFQEQVARWSVENFGHQPLYRALMGIAEEVGELMHCRLKFEQGIRQYSQTRFEVESADAIGDIIIYLADYCDRLGLSLEDCVRTTWARVRQRDWRKDREKGGEK